MKAEIKQGDGLQREVSVAVEADKVNARMEAAFADIRKNVELKGFRKGKAPLDVVRKAYGEKVRSDVAEELIKESYTEAVREHDLKVASYPTITEFNFNDDGDMNFTATVEVFPEIGKIEYTDLKISREPIEVTDDEVNQYTDHLKQRFAEERTVTRPAGEKDVVVADLTKVADSKNAIAESEFPGSRIDLSNPVTLPAFKENLPGKQAGDETEITVKYDDDYPDQTFAGSEITYKVAVKEVVERIVPELNDVLAKQTGMAETMLELRQKIRADIENQKKQEQDRGAKNDLITQMIDQNSIPVPEAMLQDYLSRVVKDVQQENPEATEDDIRAQYRGVGERGIRWNIIMHELAEQEKIEVGPSDIDKVIKRFADNYNMSEEQARQALAQSGQATQMRESLLEDKVLDFLTEQAKVETKDA